MFGTQTTPTLTPTTLKTFTEYMAGPGDEIIRQLEHEHAAGFVPPVIDYASSMFRSNQLQQQQQGQNQGQENVSNNFLPSASDNDDSNQMTDDDVDDESTSFSGGYSQCPGDSASNDSQETYSTKSSITNGNNNNSNNKNNKSGSRAKTRSTVRRTRGVRNDEKVRIGADCCHL